MVRLILFTSFIRMFLVEWIFKFNPLNVVAVVAQAHKRATVKATVAGSISIGKKEQLNKFISLFW